MPKEKPTVIHVELKGDQAEAWRTIQDRWHHVTNAETLRRLMFDEIERQRTQSVSIAKEG